MPCINLEHITLPDSLEIIEGQIVNGLRNLTSVSLGKNVRILDGIAFYGSGIVDISIDAENPYFTVKDNIVYNKQQTKIVIIGKRNIDTFEIPYGVEELGDYVFHNKAFREIKIPSTLKTIRSSFNYCKNLTKIVIPSSVEEISTSCFSFCENLNQIIIQKPKDSIPGAPWGCPMGMRSVIWEE